MRLWEASVGLGTDEAVWVEVFQSSGAVQLAALCEHFARHGIPLPQVRSSRAHGRVAHGRVVHSEHTLSTVPCCRSSSATSLAATPRSCCSCAASGPWRTRATAPPLPPPRARRATGGCVQRTRYSCSSGPPLWPRRAWKGAPRRAARTAPYGSVRPSEPQCSFGVGPRKAHPVQRLFYIQLAGGARGPSRSAAPAAALAASCGARSRCRTPLPA